MKHSNTIIIQRLLMQEDRILQLYIPHLQVLSDTQQNQESDYSSKSTKISIHKLSYWGKGEGFRDVTGVMDLGRIDNQTKPVNKLVTAKPSANRSALDCELQNHKTHETSNKIFKNQRHNDHSKARQQWFLDFHDLDSGISSLFGNLQC